MISHAKHQSVGEVARSLMVMPPRVLGRCIQDALDAEISSGNTPPNVTLNVGVAIGREHLVTVNVDNLPVTCKVAMVNAESQCSHWFTVFDSLLFNHICDNAYPLNDLNFPIGVYDIKAQIHCRSLHSLKQLELKQYIARNVPEWNINQVRQALVDKGTGITEYVGFLELVWSEIDGFYARDIVKNNVTFAGEICGIVQSYPGTFGEELLYELLELSLSKMWSNANYETMDQENQKKFQRIYKKLMLTKGRPQN